MQLRSPNESGTENLERKQCYGNKCRGHGRGDGYSMAPEDGITLGIEGQSFLSNDRIQRFRIKDHRDAGQYIWTQCLSPEIGHYPPYEVAECFGPGGELDHGWGF